MKLILGNKNSIWSVKSMSKSKDTGITLTITIFSSQTVNALIMVFHISAILYMLQNLTLKILKTSL